MLRKWRSLPCWNSTVLSITHGDYNKTLHSDIAYIYLEAFPCTPIPVYVYILNDHTSSVSTIAVNDQQDFGW